MVSLVSDVGLHEEVVVPEVAHGTHVLKLKAYGSHRLTLGILHDVSWHRTVEVMGLELVLTAWGRQNTDVKDRELLYSPKQGTPNFQNPPPQQKRP